MNATRKRAGAARAWPPTIGDRPRALPPSSPICDPGCFGPMRDSQTSRERVTAFAERRKANHGELTG